LFDTRSRTDQIPQRLPLLQEADWALENEPADPATVEAKVEICFVTWVLSQKGQDTSATALELRSSSSKGVPHSWHTNSKIGINFSFKVRSGGFGSPRFLIFNAVHQI
jgi:hypothetical protein